MESRHCEVCGQAFRPRSQSPKQSYCAEEACQRERQRRWRQLKRQTDPDYRDNQRRAQQGWTQRHPDYWRKYRARRPEYEERNRRQQQQRDERRSARNLAKSDVSKPDSAVLSGTYQLSRVGGDNLAKSDAWTVEITLVSAA